MTVKIIEKDIKTIKINDLMENVKENPRIIECGAIFSFEGIVRGKDIEKNTIKMDLTTTNIQETKAELQNIIKEIKEKHGVVEIAVIHYIGKFIPGDPLFLAVVAGAHRQETKAALNDVIERVKYELDFKKEEHTENGTNIIMSGG
ncbi:MAG: molybdenum cofactor biosynthesis protein MoaE [Methanobacterium sp.]|nr:molybdenum cofactor biosynthesis protein MoaE [Methanobacterium sp.]